MGTCCAACSRLFLVLISILHLVVGVGLIALSLWLRTDDRIEYALRTALSDPAHNPYEMFELKQQLRLFAIFVFWIAIIYGMILFMLGSIGACGACKVSRTANAVYATFLVLLLIGECLGVLFVVFRRHKADEWVSQYLAVGAQFNLSDAQIVHQRFNCCGDGTNNSYNFVCQGAQETCSSVIGTLLGSATTVGITVLAAFVALQLASFLFSCVLFINHRYRTLHEATSA